MKKFIMNSKKQKKKFICEMSRLKSTGQVEATASDWWHTVSRAEFEQSHDFQSQRAASRVAATLYSPVLRDEEGRINKKENDKEKNDMMTKQKKNREIQSIGV
jgi:hypothetical protein